MYVCMCILLSFTIVHLYLTYMYVCMNVGGASLSGIRATAERLRSPMPIYGEAFRGDLRLSLSIHTYINVHTYIHKIFTYLHRLRHR